ncbi:MAG: hypothetical protein JWP63_5727 [Candidatus Solibacter sp.]|nr:hypothetical protein [Candidatus Solibacter sp.]
MKPYFAFLPLLLAAMPAAGQIPRDRVRPMRPFPPDIISQDDVVRDVMYVGFTHVTVDSDNNRTRVLRFKLAAGEAVPTHDDRAGVLICLTECRLRFTAPDGKLEDLELKSGETRWLPAARRITRNMGHGVIEMIYVESKRSTT